MKKIRVTLTEIGVRGGLVILAGLLCICLLGSDSAAQDINASTKDKAQVSGTTGTVDGVSPGLAKTGNIRLETEYVASDSDVEKWGKWLDDPSLFAREEAAGYLSRSNNPKAAPYLVKALKDKSFTVRSYAAGSLWKFPDSKMQTILADTLKTETHNNTKYFLISSLIKLHADEHLLVPHLQHLIDTGDGGAALSRDLSDKAIKQELLNYARTIAKSSKNIKAQIDSAYVLVRFYNDNPHQYVDLFCRVLDSGDVETKGSAIYGLKKVGNQKAKNALRKALNTKDVSLRHDVENALKALGEKVQE